MISSVVIHNIRKSVSVFHEILFNQITFWMKLPSFICANRCRFGAPNIVHTSFIWLIFTNTSEHPEKFDFNAKNFYEKYPLVGNKKPTK